VVHRIAPDSHLRKHLRLAATPRSISEVRRTADVPDHLSRRDRTSTGGDDSPHRGERQLRNRGASPRVGNAAVRSRRGTRTPLCTADSARPVHASARHTDNSRRQHSWICAGVIPVGPIRPGRVAYRSAGTGRLSRRLERAPAAVRSTPGRTRFRRRTADAVSVVV
jgi:hypothetical protein